MNSTTTPGGRPVNPIPRPVYPIGSCEGDAVVVTRTPGSEIPDPKIPVSKTPGGRSSNPSIPYFGPPQDVVCLTSNGIVPHKSANLYSSCVVVLRNDPSLEPLTR